MQKYPIKMFSKTKRCKDLEDVKESCEEKNMRQTSCDGDFRS